MLHTFFLNKIERIHRNPVSHPIQSMSNPYTTVFYAPPMTKSVYVDNREIARLREQKENDNELDCPILFTPITTDDVASKRAITVAKFGQNDTIVGMSFSRAARWASSNTIAWVILSCVPRRNIA